MGCPGRDGMGGAKGAARSEAAEVPDNVPGLAASAPNANPFLLRFFRFASSPPPPVVDDGEGGSILEKRG